MTSINNTKFGENALNNNSSNNNSAFGFSSLEDNTKGFQNTALGSDALSSNQKGINNSAFGYNALLSNTEGNRNTCIGSLALKNNKKGNNNVAVGFKAGLTLINGSSNIVIGNDAQLSSSSTNNEIVIGNDASGHGSNTVVLGNSDTISIQPNKTNTTNLGSSALRYKNIYSMNNVNTLSDKNEKEDIKECDLGLSFIEKLKPVIYHLKDDEDKKKKLGLIAQDVEKTLLEINKKDIIYEKDEESDTYGLRYEELIGPIIKAIQELKKENDELKELNQQLLQKNQ